MTPIEQARLALEGLSVADAFGEQLLHAGPNARGLALDTRTAPVGRRWMWTDDTAMALSIVEILAAHGAIDEAALAHAFARRYHADPARGYGRGAHQVLAELGEGVPHDVAARALFGGEGSCGNGGGMRAAVSPPSELPTSTARSSGPPIAARVTSIIADRRSCSNEGTRRFSRSTGMPFAAKCLSNATPFVDCGPDAKPWQ